MKNQFTPGPWKYFNGHKPEKEEFTVVSPEEDKISGKGWKSKSIAIANQANEILAEVKAFDTDQFLRDFDQWEANCRLILAAPDLLEALEPFAELKGRSVLELNDMMAKAKAAIKKARGL